MIFAGIDASVGAFEYSAERSIPLATRPYLLTADTTVERMFEYVDLMRTPSAYKVR